MGKHLKGPIRRLGLGGAQTRDVYTVESRLCLLAVAAAGTPNGETRLGT